MIPSFLPVLLLVLAQAPAEDPFPKDGVQLLQPGTMTGWSPVGELPGTWRAWEVEEGRHLLRAPLSPSTLHSDWTLGDFRLDFRFSVEKGGQLCVVLRGASAEEEIAAILREGESCGSVLRGGSTVATGIPLKGEGPHAAQIRRVGESLKVTVDDSPAAAVEIAAGARFGLGFRGAGAAELRDLVLREPVGRPLFNGKDLEGWWSDGDLQAWQVEDGEIRLKPKGGRYLRSEQLFSDFTLSFEYAIEEGGNSGVGIRTPREGWPSGQGMELQILSEPKDAPLTPSSLMAIYARVKPLARADRTEQFNRVVIKVEGPIVSAWVNGVLSQHFDVSTHKELSRRPTEGWVGFQDHSNWLRLRNVRILERNSGH